MQKLAASWIFLGIILGGCSLPVEKEWGELPLSLIVPLPLAGEPMSQATSLVFDPLCHVSLDGEFHPDVAERVEYLPDSRFLLILSKMAEFSDGQEISAVDVEYSFATQFHWNAFNRGTRLAWQHVSSVKIDDASSVMVAYTGRKDDALREICRLFVVPKYVYTSRLIEGRESLDLLRREKPVGSGAWYVHQVIEDNHVVLKEKRWYKKSLWNPRRWFFPRERRVPVVAADDKAPGLRLRFLGFNLNHSLAGDLQLRRRVQKAVNRERWNCVEESSCVVYSSLFSKKSNALNSTARNQETELKTDLKGKMKQLKLEVLVEDGMKEFHVQGISDLSTALLREGIFLELKTMSWSEIKTRLASGDFACFLGSWGGYWDEKIGLLLGSLEQRPGVFNLFDYRSEEVNSLLVRIAKDEIDAESALVEIDELVSRDVPLIVLNRSGGG